MKHQIKSLIYCWFYTTSLILLLFVALFFWDNHSYKGDYGFMFQVIAAIVWLSIPGVMAYALLCLGLAMLNIRPLTQLVVRVLISWVYAWPFLALAVELLRLQSIAFASIIGITVGISWHWTKTKHGFTLVNANQ